MITANDERILRALKRACSEGMRGNKVTGYAIPDSATSDGEFILITEPIGLLNAMDTHPKHGY